MIETSPPAPAPTLRAAQKQLTRSRILAAARGRFEAAGVAGASMDEIAERAGVARATVYLHYRTKDAVLLDLMIEDWDLQAGHFERLAARAPLDRDTVAGWLRRLVKATALRRESLSLYSQVLGQDPNAAGRLHAHRTRLIGILGARFAAFRPGPDGAAAARARIAAHLLVVQIEQFCVHAAQPFGAPDLDAGVALLAERFCAFVEAAEPR